MSFKSLKKFLLGMAVDCAVLCLVSQSCLTLCDPMVCSLPGSSVHGILQERRLECVAISFSRGIFPTQGPSSPSFQAVSCIAGNLYRLSHPLYFLVFLPNGKNGLLGEKYLILNKI